MSKIIFIRLLVLCFFSQGLLAGTSAQGVSEVFVSLSVNNESLTKTFKTIEEQTNFKFVFSKNVVTNHNENISLDMPNKSLRSILENIAIQTGLVFKQINKTISVRVNDKYYPDINNQQIENGKIIGTIRETSTGEPLIGANLIIVGTTIGTATNIEGKYELAIPESMFGQHVFINAKFVGYKSKLNEVTLSSQTTELNFELEEDVFLSEEVVVTGIASKTSKAVAEVSVARISASELTAKQSYTGLSQLVGGKISGVQLTTSSGNVTSGFRFHVRGGGGLNGDEQPAIYVDGVRMDNSEIIGSYVGGQGFNSLTGLNVSDIENIEILKGPAAAAMYGTSGSNGVVLITTKTGMLIPGAEGKVSVDYRFNYGLNTQQFNYREEDYYEADVANNDLFKTGSIRDHNLSISGGTPVLRYFASLQNRQESGILYNDFMDKTSMRANFSAFPADNLSVKVNVGYNILKASRPHSDDSLLGPMGAIILYDVAFKDAKLADMKALDDDNKQNEFVGSTQISWEPIKNLEFQAGAGIHHSDLRTDQTWPADIDYGFISNGRRDIFQRNNRQLTFDLNGRYSYAITEKIKATSIVGTQIFDRLNNTQLISVYNFTSSLLQPIQAGEEVRIYEEYLTPQRSAGLFTEHSFSYSDQYFLTLALRRDYASAIGIEAPASTYPKASFALRLDKYDFLPSEINLFKLRAAYGESGMLPSLKDGMERLWEAQVGGYGAGAVMSAIGNPSIKPERIKEIEIGFDTEFFTNYSLELTYFTQYASNSLIYKQNSPSTGLTASDIPFNIGEMKNSGLETLLMLNPVRSKDYDLNMSIIYNYQDNEVTSLGGASAIYSNWPYLNIIDEGLSKHEFWGTELIGAQFDENGVYIGPETTEEKTLGNPIPKQTGSFSFNFRFLKNFNLYALADWGVGHKVYDNSHRFAAWSGGNVRYWELATLVGWEDPANNANIPDDLTPLTPGSTEYIAAANELATLDPNVIGNYAKDGDYFVIREASLSYDFSDLFAESDINNYFKKVVMGISVRNLLRLSKYKSGDFENNFAGSRSLTRGVEFLSLPQPRTINFWVNVGF